MENFKEMENLRETSNNCYLGILFGYTNSNKQIKLKTNKKTSYFIILRNF